MASTTLHLLKGLCGYYYRPIMTLGLVLITSVQAGHFSLLSMIRENSTPVCQMCVKFARLQLPSPQAVTTLTVYILRYMHHTV